MSLAARLGLSRPTDLDLKWVLVRRILLVAVVSMIGGALLVLHDVRRQADIQNEEAAATVEKQLSWQLTRIDAALDLANRFPDWDAVVNYALRPGQCLQYVASGSRALNSHCQGTDLHAQIAPEWFVRAYERYPGESVAELPLTHKGEHRGTIRTTLEARAIAESAWSQLSRLIGIAAAMIFGMCLLVYVAIEKALRPTATILAGLNRLADGDLTHRLPRLRMKELDRIAVVFNDLAQKLELTTQERAELARKLVNAQEQERQHIARELHDDVAQRLSVVNGLATSIKRSCKKLAPTVARQSEELVTLASGTMRSLRDTLRHLRPPEIDDLGLVASIQTLVDEHNRRAQGATVFALQHRGSYEGLPPEMAAHVYRIVQESLNNAARHANACNVSVVMEDTIDEMTNARAIELAVLDDGIGPTLTTVRTIHFGLGLAGIRERVYALSGTFTAKQRQPNGFELRVSFPVQVAGENAA